MKNVIKNTIMGMATLLLTLPIVASAYDEPEPTCVIPDVRFDDLGILADKVTSAIFLSDNLFKTRVQDRLYSTAMNAESKISKFKLDDAIDKLDAIVTKIDDLLSAPKPKVTKGKEYLAEEISSLAVDTIECIMDFQDPD